MLRISMASVLFVVAMVPHLRALAEGDALPAGFEGCPEWLPDYIKFHREQRENATAKRLTLTDQVIGLGFGYGDRLRALAHGLKSAATSNRCGTLKNSCQLSHLSTCRRKEQLLESARSSPSKVSAAFLLSGF